MKKTIQVVQHPRVKEALAWLVILISAPFALQYLLTFVLLVLLVVVDIFFMSALAAIGLVEPGRYVFVHVTLDADHPHRLKRRAAFQSTTVNVEAPKPDTAATGEASPHSSHPEPLFVPASDSPDVAAGQDDMLQRRC